MKQVLLGKNLNHKNNASVILNHIKYLKNLPYKQFRDGIFGYNRENKKQVGNTSEE